MQLTVVSLAVVGTAPEPIREFNRAIAPGETIVTSQFKASDLPAMTGLLTLESLGKVSIAVVYSTAEKKFLIPPDAIQAGDMMPVDAAALDSPIIEIRKPLVAGMAAAADDVTIYAVNTLPYKLRITDAYLMVSAGALAGRNVQVRDVAGGGGTLGAQVDAVVAGRNPMSATFLATTVLSPGAMLGLFARRSHDAIAGELFIMGRREL